MAADREQLVATLASDLLGLYRTSQLRLKRNPSSVEVVTFLLDHKLLAKLHAKSGAGPSPRPSGPKQSSTPSSKPKRKRGNGVTARKAVHSS